MNALEKSGEAILLAHAGQQRIAAALAAGARCFARGVLARLGHRPPSARMK